MMKKVVFAAVVAAVLTGCQTRITAEKFAEVAHPVEKVVQVNGEDRVIVERYQVTSGGWYATARSPLYATEALDGLALGVETNGAVRLALQSYSRDVSTNAVAMVGELFTGGAKLATAIADAYVKIAGGGAQVGTVAGIGAKVMRYFSEKGGDVSKATVETVGDKVRVCDGGVCIDCDAAGVCSECSL